MHRPFMSQDGKIAEYAKLMSMNTTRKLQLKSYTMICLLSYALYCALLISCLYMYITVLYLYALLEINKRNSVYAEPAKM